MKSKKLFLILTGIYVMVVGYAFAQKANMRNEPANLGAIKMIGDKNTGGSKTTALQSRLVGITNTMHNGAFYQQVDSTAYKYSGNRGGDLQSDKLKFDNGQAWTYSSGSGVYNDDIRFFQSFDTRDNILSTTYEKWNTSSSSWLGDHKYLYTYDMNNNMVGYIYQTWNTSTGNWLNVSHYIYTYDSKGNLLTQIYQSWVTSSESWRNISKNTFTYNANNDYLSKLYQSWNTSSNVWVNSDQELYTYDSAGNMLTDITMYWITSGSGSWRNSDKTSWIYNVNNNATSMLLQSWTTFGSGSWNNQEQHLYTYDTLAVNNLLLDHKHLWGGSSWNNDEQRMYTYDAAGNRLTEQRQTWVGWPTNNWRNSYRHTSTYDSRKNQLSHLEETWNTTSNLWVNNRMYEYTFNNYNQMTSDKSDTWNLGGFWFPTTSDHYNRYYYQEYGSTGIAGVEQQVDMKLYPVPASGTLNIDLGWNKAQQATIVIFDMQGRNMAQWQTENTNRYHKAVDVSQLPAGIYILKVQGTNDATVQQFTVAH